MEFSVCTVGPNESEQDSFEGGKVDGDKLTFDVPQGPNGEGSIHVEMQVKGDQMTGRATWSGPGVSGSGKISLKRVVDRGVVPEPDLAGLGSTPGMLDHVLSKIEPHAN